MNPRGNGPRDGVGTEQSVPKAGPAEVLVCMEPLAALNAVAVANRQFYAAGRSAVSR